MLPELPTFAEQGMDDPAVTLSGWIGILAASGTPRANVARLNQLVRSALEQPEIRTKLESYGLDVVSTTTEEFESNFRAETPKWLKMITDAGVKLD